MPKSDFKTICNAVVEGSLTLGGCTIFFSKLFGTVTSKFTSFNPLVSGISLQGLLFSIPFSTVAAYGAYKCHDEIGLSNQPLEKLRILNEVAAETKTAEESLIADETNDEIKAISDEELHRKTKAELISIIHDLQTFVAEQKAQLTGEEAEKNAAQATPLKYKQQLGIIGEYVAHSAGFTGDILGIISLFGSLPFEAELVLQGCCLIVGYISAMSEARTAEESMRLNNMREKLSMHHGLFKQQAAQHKKIEVHVDNMMANPITISAESSSSAPYQKLAGSSTYPRQ